MFKNNEALQKGEWEKVKNKRFGAGTKSIYHKAWQSSDMSPPGGQMSCYICL